MLDEFHLNKKQNKTRKPLWTWAKIVGMEGKEGEV